MTDNFRKLSECMKKDPELQGKIDAEVSRLLENKEAADPGEATAKAIKTVMNIDLTDEDLKSSAEISELSPDAMEEVVGGNRDGRSQYQIQNSRCDKSPSGGHYYEYTGTKRPGTIWGDTWPDYLYKCKYCGKEDWKWFNN